MRDRFVWIGSAIYALAFFGLGAWKYADHRNLIDFGIFLQTTTSAFGCFCNTIEGSHWAFHFSPILYAVGALMFVFRSPLTLIALSAVGAALVAPPIAAIVRTRTDLATARVAALVVWLYPPLAGLAFVEFHENSLVPAAIVWMLWAFHSGRLRLTLLFAALALTMKEDQALFLAFAGLLAAWRFRGTSYGRAGLLIAVASIMVFVYFFRDIQPHANALVGWQPTRFYAWTKSDLAHLPLGLLKRVGFVVLIFAPLAFLPLRSRWMWLAVPPLAEVLLSRLSMTYNLSLHYAGAWIGYMLVAFAHAVRMRRILWWGAAFAVLELVVANPLHPGVNLRLPQARDARLDRFLRRLPPTLAVATQEEAYTHLAVTDPNATLLPEQASEPLPAPFVLIDRDFPKSPRLEEYGARIAALARAGTLRVVRRDGGIILYRAKKQDGRALSRSRPRSEPLGSVTRSPY